MCFSAASVFSSPLSFFQENKIINNIKTVVIAVGAVETVEKSVEYPELFLAVT